MNNVGIVESNLPLCNPPVLPAEHGTDLHLKRQGRLFMNYIQCDVSPESAIFAFINVNSQTVPLQVRRSVS